LTGTLQSLREEALRTRRQHILNVDFETGRVWNTMEGMTIEELDLAMRRARPIPGGARVAGVEFPPETRVASGRAEIRFYGDGHSDKVLIHLQHGGAYSSFLLEPFLSQVKMFDYWVGFNDLR